MSSKVPTINGPVSWLSVIFQLLVITGIYFIYTKLEIGEMTFILAALTYCFLAITLRKIIAKQHRQGVKFMMQKKFEEAIPYFGNSYTFFTKNSWIDKFRFITLLSATGRTYSEMALLNIAFSYSQIGEGEKAKEYYKKALTINPHNGAAEAGLKMLNSIAQNTTN